MAGAYILWNDILASGPAPISISHSGSGSSTVAAGLPLTNMLDRRVAKVARILRTGVDPSDITTITFGNFSNTGVRGVAIVGWAKGGSPTATFQVQLTNFSGVITYFDSGEISCSLETGVQSILFVPVDVDTSSATKLLVKYRDTGAVTGSYLDVGRVFLANGIKLANGVDFDISMSAVDEARVMRSRGKQLYAESVTRYRRSTCKVTQITEDTAINTSAVPTSPSFQTLGLQAGSSGEVIIAPRTGDELVKRRLTVYGRLTKPPDIRHQGGGYYETELEVEEGL